MELRSVVSFCVLYNGMRARFPLDMNMRVFIMGSYPERASVKIKRSKFVPCGIDPKWERLWTPKMSHFGPM